jgi:hypothetical protein
LIEQGFSGAEHRRRIIARFMLAARVSTDGLDRDRRRLPLARDPGESGTMVQLKHSERRILEDALGMGSGYVLNFSDRTFAEFFDDQGITIYQEKYAFNGSSKAKHMRAFIEVEDAFTVCRVMRQLWELVPDKADPTGSLKTRFFALLDRLESGGAVPRTDAIDRFARDETLDELVASIGGRARSPPYLLHEEVWSSSRCARPPMGAR